MPADAAIRGRTFPGMARFGRQNAEFQDSRFKELRGPVGDVLCPVPQATGKVRPLRLRLIGVLPIARYPGASNRRRFVDAVW
jgi:hypothetical protein